MFSYLNWHPNPIQRLKIDLCLIPFKEYLGRLERCTVKEKIKFKKSMSENPHKK